VSGALELYGATHSRRTSGGILESVLWSQSCTRKSDAWRPENPSLRLSSPWWWDNLNTHGMGFLYEAFPPEQARRLASCLERVMHSHKGNTTVGTEAKRVPKRVDWPFSTLDARVKLKTIPTGASPTVVSAKRTYADIGRGRAIAAWPSQAWNTTLDD
jgi:hypothetical protein